MLIVYISFFFSHSRWIASGLAREGFSDNKEGFSTRMYVYPSACVFGMAVANFNISDE